MLRRRITTSWRVVVFAALLLSFMAIAILLAAYPNSLTSSSETPSPTLLVPARFGDFWSGTAAWVLEVPDTGLPIGESDTIDMGNGVFWSYLHASAQSAGILDSCGDPVEFPGCVTRWISVDGGVHFTLAEPKCLLPCNSCPCDQDDMVWQQQYPRVARSPDNTFYMVFENGAATWMSVSDDGITWGRPSHIEGTGLWRSSQVTCSHVEQIGQHPSFTPDGNCMVGGPPGLTIADGQIFVFVGLGQNPGHMGCMKTSLGSSYFFHRCSTNPLFDGASEYGPIDASGAAANPYFDFRFVTSADVIEMDGYYYMSYEGIRGPSSSTAGRDNQYGLGFARSLELDGRWEKYPGNPVLDNVVDNWGIGHADLIVTNGTIYMYAGTPQMTRGRYMLAFK
ncbi:MAG: hypothetical protein JXB07_07475 [Anaerolineae bacterium]|nr:hypothetical protein [Anaerolineae bacterium]